jgi:cyclohexanecarboxylate-CoA ligase
MSEHAIGVAGRPMVDDDRALTADGLPLQDCEIRIAPHPADTAVGPLLLRSPGLFAGYYDEPELTAASVDRAGWLDTGDLAEVAADGWVTIGGRSKDVVIRGGMNIPVVDIENLVAAHPRVHEVAVVGVSDDRLGERAVAFVVLRDDDGMELEEMTSYLLGAGLSKHYLPEGLVVIDALPKTPSGKVRKVELRSWGTAPSA